MARDHYSCDICKKLFRDDENRTSDFEVAISLYGDSHPLRTFPKSTPIQDYEKENGCINFHKRFKETCPKCREKISIELTNTLKELGWDGD